MSFPTAPLLICFIKMRLIVYWQARRPESPVLNCGAADGAAPDSSRIFPAPVNDGTPPVLTHAVTEAAGGVHACVLVAVWGPAGPPIHASSTNMVGLGAAFTRWREGGETQDSLRKTGRASEERSSSVQADLYVCCFTPTRFIGKRLL